MGLVRDEEGAMMRRDRHFPAMIRTSAGSRNTGLTVGLHDFYNR